MPDLIEITVKRSYGVERLYITGVHKKAVQSLTKKATVDYQDLEALSDLGFRFEIKHQLENSPTYRLIQNFNERRNWNEKGFIWKKY